LTVPPIHTSDASATPASSGIMQKNQNSDLRKPSVTGRFGLWMRWTGDQQRRKSIWYDSCPLFVTGQGNPVLNAKMTGRAIRGGI